MTKFKVGDYVITNLQEDQVHYRVKSPNDIIKGRIKAITKSSIFLDMDTLTPTVNGVDVTPSMMGLYDDYISVKNGRGYKISKELVQALTPPVTDSDRLFLVGAMQYVADTTKITPIFTHETKGNTCGCAEGTENIKKLSIMLRKIEQTGVGIRLTNT